MNRAEGAPPFARAAMLALLALMVVGGGAAQFFLMVDVVPRLAALGLVSIAVWYLGREVLPRRLWLGLGLLVAIPAFQLVPLPGGLWSALPGSERAVAILAAAGVDSGWQQLSLAPSRTLDSLLFLLVPIAAAMLGYGADRRQRHHALIVVVALAAVSLALGVVQLLEGAGGASYLYSVTNEGSAVGLFANRNHNGLLLALAIALLWPLAEAVGERGMVPPRTRVITIAAAALLFGGIVMTGSRAALGLGCLALIALVAALMLSPRDPSTRSRSAVLGRPAVAALLLVAGIAAGSAVMILGTFADEGFNRADVYPIIAGALSEHWLFGSGMGSFEWVARGFEDRATITFAYWNHAHNDIAQLLIEAGVAGLVVLAGAVLWFTAAARSYLSSLRQGKGRSALIEAALLGLVLIAGHSLVDYPLRTAAISAVAFLLIGMVEAETRRRASVR
jgi:hypothetical protein